MILRWRLRLLRWLITRELRHAERVVRDPWDRQASLRIDRLIIAREALERIRDER